MTTIIRVTEYLSKHASASILVNGDQITHVRPSGELTHLHFSNERFVVVVETVEQVASLIAAAEAVKARQIHGGASGARPP